jgi:hypothetical protein
LNTTMTHRRSTRRASIAALAALFAVGAAFSTRSLRAADALEWEPRATRVFIVSLARFQGNSLHSFSLDERLEDQFAALFKERGVPAEKICLLKDDQATAQNIQSEFANFLRQSSPGEMLFFYFGSHGGYDSAAGKFWFYAYDDKLPFDWAVNTIERDFKGRRAMLATDCCFSGGMSELVARRKSRIAYASLSSTFSHQTAWSGWRFMQCLMRGLAGNAVVDLNDDGNVELDELAEYTAHYMAFAAEGKPMFSTTGDLSPKLLLAKSSETKRSQVGELLEAKSGTTWAKAEVLDVKPARRHVHFTGDTRSAHDVWVGDKQTRPFEFPRYPVGATVEVLDSHHNGWHAARVLERSDSLHLCRGEGRSSAYDEWFGPSRIRASAVGSWRGVWRNNLNESGPDSLDVGLDQAGRLQGTWSGEIAVQPERLGNDVFLFAGRASNRLYRGAWRINGEQLELDYCAHGSSQRYYGSATMRRSGDASAPTMDSQAEFSGAWVGTYENSRAGSGAETLSLVERSGQLEGDWSGVDVSGERLGPTSFYLEGKLGTRTYHIVGRIAKGRLTLNYSASSESEQYFGWSTLEHSIQRRE